MQTRIHDITPHSVQKVNVQAIAARVRDGIRKIGITRREISLCSVFFLSLSPLSLSSADCYLVIARNEEEVGSAGVTEETKSIIRLAVVRDQCRRA